MTRYFFLFIAIIFFQNAHAQELFPLSPPASTVPKGALGIRFFSEDYKEKSLLRNMFAAQVMYGLTSKLTVSATTNISNFHSTNFPSNLSTHVHTESNSTTYNPGSYQKGVPYPYSYSGIYLYAKYRFFSSDGNHQHIRLAVYADWSNVNVVHSESEPTLLVDTKGFGGGLIATYLKNHFAISLTTGLIIPGSFSGYSYDTTGSGQNIPTKMQYGRALKYNLSLGYLLFPRAYKNYNQTNWNIYLEFIGKSYEQAKITQYGFLNIPVASPVLKAGNYVEVYPGIQSIVKSNLRIDFSVGFPIINKSFVHFYPVFMLGVQRYFFFHKKNPNNDGITK